MPIIKTTKLVRYVLAIPSLGGFLSEVLDPNISRGSLYSPSELAILGSSLY